MTDQDYTWLIDGLLEKECYIIDYLPQTVEPNGEGQFWDVEYVRCRIIRS